MSEHRAGAGSDPAPAFVRPAVLADGEDAAIVSRLLAAYLLQTEREKGSAVTRASALPARYRREVEHPAQAFAGAALLLGELDGQIAGMVVVTEAEQGRCEMKRLWTEPGARGRGGARALIDACVAHATQRGDVAVELTVWSWRERAVRLYERAGFERVLSWDERPDLVCLRRTL